MNVFLTGATGFVGRFIIDELIQKGHNVYCLVRGSKGLSELSVEYPAENFKFEEIKQPQDTSIDQLKSILEQEQINTIVHCAAIAREYRLPWDEYYRVNVQWTRDLALSFMHSNVEHSKFIYVSTVGVYGTIPIRCPADEDTPYQPDGKYHRSKMMAEIELIKLKNNAKMPLVVFRPSIMYGDGDHGFLYKILKLASTRIVPFNAKSHKIHLLDANTFAKIVELAVNSSSKKFDNYIYNISDNKPIHTRDLIEFMLRGAPRRYMAIASFLLPMLEYSTKLDPVMNIKIKLLRKNWYYDVQRVQNDFGYSLIDTYANLEKYKAWYQDAIYGNPR